MLTNHPQSRGCNNIVSTSNEISQMQTFLLTEIILQFLTLPLNKDIKTIIRDLKPYVGHLLHPNKDKEMRLNSVSTILDAKELIVTLSIQLITLSLQLTTLMKSKFLSI